MADIGPGWWCLSLSSTVTWRGRCSCYVADKLATLRVLPDEQGRMNLSLLDTGGSALVVTSSRCWGCAKGRRPSFDAAAQPEAQGDLELLVAGLAHAVSPHRAASLAPP